MKKLCLLVVSLFTMIVFSTPTVTDVTVRQCMPVDGFVDITVTLEGSVDEIDKTECVFVATNCATRTAVPVKRIRLKGSDAGSGTIRTRRYIWNASKDIGRVKIDNLAFTVDVELVDGIQLWENGPYWAECNVGATKPEEYGYYFWWGDTVGYKRNAENDGWVSVKDGSGFSFSWKNCPTHNIHNSRIQSLGYIDSTGNLEAAHDAATAHLGMPWRMPTDAELAALIDNCTSKWITTNGVAGMLITGKGTYISKSIFLPAAGYGEYSSLEVGSDGFYWSATTYSNDSSLACYLNFLSGRIGTYGNLRYRGRSVRPLRGFTK